MTEEPQLWRLGATSPPFCGHIQLLLHIVTGSVFIIIIIIILNAVALEHSAKSIFLQGEALT